MHEQVQSILSAAREDIANALGCESVRGFNNFAILERDLTARDFARVLFITRRAEAIACAEGRTDWTRVLTEALDELEAKAPRMHAAIRKVLLGGHVLVERKYQQLEADHAKLRAGVAVMQETLENARNRALTSGNESRKYLSSGDTGSALARIEAKEDDVAEELAGLSKTLERILPRDPAREAEGEIQDENETHKEPPFRV